MRRTLLGLVAGSLLLGVACGENDDDVFGSTATTRATDPAEVGDGGSSEPDGGSGYTEGLEASFIGRCVAGIATEQQCQCVFDEFVANVPNEEYVALDEALRSGEMTGDELPAWLTDAQAACGINA